MILDFFHQLSRLVLIPASGNNIVLGILPFPSVASIFSVVTAPALMSLPDFLVLTHIACGCFCLIGTHWIPPQVSIPPSFLYPFKSQKHGENLFINTKNIFVCMLSVLILSSLFPPRARPTLPTDTHARYQRVYPEYWNLFLPPADILRCHPTASSTLACVRLYLVW